MNKTQQIAFLLPSLEMGGLQRVAINLLKGLAQQGIPLDLVVADAKGSYLNEIPPTVRLIDFQIPLADRLQSASKVIFPLVRYLRTEKPIALMSHLNIFNVVAAIAKTLAISPVKLALVEHTSFQITYEKSNKPSSPRDRVLPIVRRWFYPYSDAIVAVSKGLGQDLESYLKMKPGSINTIYNPVIDDSLLSKSQALIEHPWLRDGEPPVILGVGRLSKEKDFATLIRAFATVRQTLPARLMILGGGKEQSGLNNLVRELGLENDVAMPGFVDNPYAYLARSAVFVLSSYREGLPTVIIEAMALGTPVVSTDCPNGPSEILDNGKYGELVPVGDSTRIAQAIVSVLSGQVKQVDPAWLEQFTLANALQKYLNVLGISERVG